MNKIPFNYQNYFMIWIKFNTLILLKKINFLMILQDFNHKLMIIFAGWNKIK